MPRVKLFPSFLLLVASLLFLYIQASFGSSPDQFMFLLVGLEFALLLLSLPAYWLTRDGNWAGLLLMIVVLGLFSSGIFAFSYFFTISLAVMLLAVTFRLLKKRLTLNYFFVIANLLSAVAITLSGAILFPRFTSIPFSYYESYRQVENPENSVFLDSSTQVKPDIYYIVLDGYGRSNMLNELYGFDNSEFVQYLQQKGFVIPQQSHSNYPRTALSVASTLNMDYVQSFAPNLQASPLWWLMVPWLQHSRVRNSLKAIGYKSVSISSDWSITDNPTADIYFKSHPIIVSDFDRYFIGITPMKTFEPFFERFSSLTTYNAHRISQLNNFKSLVKSVDVTSPKFVFAHILLPHPPFVFSQDGSPINPDYAFSLNDGNNYKGTPLQYADHYIAQMQFLNRNLEAVIDSVLEHSSQPPIIILQADHGPGMLTDFDSSANTCLEERFSNFSAYYLPGMDPNVIPEDITPVNLFRILFNEYFNTGLPLLENAYYYPKQSLAIYDLENVTSLLKRQDNCVVK